MKVEEFISRLAAKSYKLNLPEFSIGRRGFSYVKIRIEINTNTIIEIYFNDQMQSITSALLIENQRVFGIDGYPSNDVWHMHPVDQVNRHLTIEPMQIEEILQHHIDTFNSLGYSY